MRHIKYRHNRDSRYPENDESQIVAAQEQILELQEQLGQLKEKLSQAMSQEGLQVSVKNLRKVQTRKGSCQSSKAEVPMKTQNEAVTTEALVHGRPPENLPSAIQRIENSYR